MSFVYRFLKLVFRELRRQLGNVELSRRFNCCIDITVRLHYDYLADLIIGPNVNIGAYTTIHVKNDTNTRNSTLEIGEKTYIGELNNIRAGGGSIRIGKQCLISQQVSIIAANHNIKKGVFIAEQPWSTDNNFVEIGDDVWIGCGAQILPGVKIGSGAIIAAGSLVNRDVPENAVVVGNPARVLKYRS